MDRILYRQEDKIGYLTLNRTDKYNAVDNRMLDEFEAFIAARMYDNTVSVIILDGGAAKGFCAGLDMQTFGPEIFAMAPADAYNAQARLSRMMLGLRKIPQPVICCVHGAAAGIGFSLAMASDIRILAEDARFSAAYINIGLGGAELAKIMASKNPLGLRMTKEAININMDAGGLEACLQMEDRNQMMLSFGMHFQAK